MTTPAPWWANDPDIAEILRRTAEEFGIDQGGTDQGGTDRGEGELEPEERELDLDEDDPAAFGVRDPVMLEIFTGACRRELSAARDDLARSRERYDAAVLKARTAGFSWGEMANVLGVSRQQLHRRFSSRRPG